ncbi:MAG: hypothetical protein Q9160_002887 [Pyrenula sp. 1 TL-2023]
MDQGKSFEDELSYAQLCKFCSQIPFAALSCPSFSDLEKARKARKENKKISTLLPLREDESIQSAPEAATIALGVLERQAFMFPDSVPIPKNDEVALFAITDTLYYGYITDSPMDVEGTFTDAYFLIRRLSIKAEKVSDPLSRFVFDYFAQPCHIGACLNSNDSTIPFPLKSARSDQMIFGGRRRPKEVKLDWLLYWILTCESRHEMTCRLEDHQLAEMLTPRIRLIDVNRKCLREFKNVNISTIRFAALSYVWGKTQTLKLTRENHSQLERENALATPSLPRTISDAIDLTGELGIEFIWIDALCILQDDPIDQGEQISGMATIYRAAFFTLIAASGDNSDAGLPGFRPGTRKFEQREVVVIPPDDYQPGLSLISTCKAQRINRDKRNWSGYEHIDVNVWNTRGWTLQERILSRRNLIFTKEQVMWVCDGGLFCEESYFEHPDEGDEATSLSHTPLRFGLFGKSLNVLFYQSLDGARLTASRERFWEKYKMLIKRFTGCNLSYPGDIFDAFRGITDALQRLSDESFFESSTIDAFVHRSKPLRLLPINRANRYDNLAIESSSVKHVSPDDIPWKPNVSSAVSVDDVQFELPELYGQRLQKLPEEHVVFFWASSVTLYLDTTGYSQDAKPSKVNDGHQNPRPNVFDANGRAVGSIGMTETEHRKDQNCYVSTTAAKSTEFVAVARRSIPELPEFPSIVLALQIVWEGGIANRVSIAEIEEAAWMNAEPTWKLVALM